MRIATSNMFDTSISTLQRRQEMLQDSQQRLTSGKRVQLASDDPTAAARAERALAAIARNEANQRSLDASRNVMNITESALGDTVELIQSARETLVAAGNGSYTDGERKALAVKLPGLSGGGPRYLTAVVSEPRHLTWGGAEVSCLVIEYQGDGAVTARTVPRPSRSSAISRATAPKAGLGVPSTRSSPKCASMRRATSASSSASASVRQDA